jgi:hypothetical protein
MSEIYKNSEDRKKNKSLKKKKVDFEIHKDIENIADKILK